MDVVPRQSHGAERRGEGESIDPFPGENLCGGGRGDTEPVGASFAGEFSRSPVLPPAGIERRAQVVQGFGGEPNGTFTGFRGGGHGLFRFRALMRFTLFILFGTPVFPRHLLRDGSERMISR